MIRTSLHQSVLPRVLKREAFTLVELLVVIGIITVLIALLLPGIARTRNSVQTAQCLSNLRQLGTAMRAYVGDNNGMFPRPGVLGAYEDWIYWDGRNPAGGRIVPYIGGVSVMNKVLNCPANTGNTYVPSYPYSYSVNEYLCRVYQPNTTSISQVLNSSETIMAICESSQTIDDGCWAAQNYLDGEFVNLLSNRHDMQRESRYDYLVTDDLSGRGTVVFVDGHAELISRAESLDPNHYMAYPGQIRI